MQVGECLIRGAAPELRRVNGIGTTLLGRFGPTDVRPMYFAMTWVTVFFVPVTPTGIYLVGPSITAGGRVEYTRFVFYGRIPSADLGRLYPGAILKLIGSSLLHALLFAVLLLAGLFVMGMAITLFRVAWR
jgi:hypothetical protein